MSDHYATAQTWGTRHRAGCHLCGWLSRPLDSEDAAARAAERHNSNAPKRDAELHRRLYVRGSDA